jgi:hypothetical protein
MPPFSVVKHHVSPKHWYLPSCVHGVTTQKEIDGTTIYFDAAKRKASGAATPATSNAVTEN